MDPIKLNEIASLVISVEETGKNIRKLRKERKVTVSEIQEVMGFREPRTIYKWQKGETLPTLDNMVRLSAILDVTIEEILVLKAA